MGWYFGGTDHVTIANNSALDIPNDDWTYCGWYRVASNTGTAYKRLFTWGTAGSTPHIQVYLAQSGTGVANADRLSARVIDPSSNDTGFIYPLAFSIGSHTNKWIPWCLTHDNSSGITYLRVWSPSAKTVYTGTKTRSLGAITNTDITAAMYVGATSALSTDRLAGDLAEFSYIPGIFWPADVFRGFAHGSRAHRFPERQWSLPMLAGRYEAWKSQLTVTNNGSAASTGHPPLQLITPQVPAPYDSAAGPQVYTRSASSTLSLTQAAASSIKSTSGSSTLALTQVADFDNFIHHKSATSTLSLLDDATFVGPKWVDAQSVIPLTQDTYFPQTHELSVTSPSTLSQSTTIGGTLRLDAESTIVLSGIADNIIKIRDAASQISLTQAASYERILTVHSQINLTQTAQLGAVSKSTESQINLTQVARHQPLPQSVESQINLTQSVRQNIRYVYASSQIELTHAEIDVKPIRADGTSELSEQDWVNDPVTGELVYGAIGLRQTAEVLHSGAVAASSIISFNTVVGLTHVKASGTSVSASTAIALTQDATLSETAAGTSALTLTQAAAGWAGRPGDSALELTHEAVVNIVQTFTGQSRLGLSQAAAYTLIVASTTCQYSPFVGETTNPDAPTPPSTSLQGPMAGIQVPFQLLYPSTGAVTDSVSLKTPNLGNIDRLSFNRIQRETRGGTLVIFADPTWPKIQTLVLTFSGLKNVEAQKLLTFIDDHIGQEIGLIDWEHRYWRGVITTPDEPIVEDSFDAFTASFEFQGELDPTWNP